MKRLAGLLSTLGNAEYFSLLLVGQYNINAGNGMRDSKREEPGKEGGNKKINWYHFRTEGKAQCQGVLCPPIQERKLIQFDISLPQSSNKRLSR